jgi:regulator of extracellular matrix RemA (YlzA/DUF370 family)
MYSSRPVSEQLEDAGQVLDAVRALRRLVAALDSATFCLSALDDEALSERLTEDASAVMAHLEQLERTPAYQAIRKEHLT